MRWIGDWFCELMLAVSFLVFVYWLLLAALFFVVSS